MSGDYEFLSRMYGISGAQGIYISYSIAMIPWYYVHGIYFRMASLFWGYHKLGTNEASQRGASSSFTTHLGFTTGRPPPLSNSWTGKSQTGEEIQQCNWPVFLQNSFDTGYNCNLSNAHRTLKIPMYTIGLSARASHNTGYILPVVDPARDSLP